VAPRVVGFYRESDNRNVRLRIPCPDRATIWERLSNRTSAGGSTHSQRLSFEDSL
jgi:hypothetical protein